MATNNQHTTAQAQEFNEIRNRLDWLEQERRKQTKRISELEQHNALQQRDIHGREERIQELESRLVSITAQQTRQLSFETDLAQFKDETVKLIEQYDQRRINSETESDRVRRIEYEGLVREISNIRKELPSIPRLQQDMELRVAEESRLANLIGGLQGRITAVANDIETYQHEFSFVEEKERQNSRNVADLQTSLLEQGKRIDPLHDRIELLSGNLLRTETNMRTATDNLESLRETMKSWLEQIQLGEHERKRQMEIWRELLDTQEDRFRRFEKEWIDIQNQSKDLKLSMQTFPEWQNQVEKQQREASEVLRVETHRLQSRWDNFRQENEKHWRTFETDTEQRWSAASRMDKQLHEQIHELETTLANLEHQKNTLDRIQAAQADAIKKLPMIWLEEVEKAIAQDPNRRRGPALVQVRED